MSTFTATYAVLPTEIVELLALPTPYERPVENEIRVSEETAEAARVHPSSP